MPRTDRCRTAHRCRRWGMDRHRYAIRGRAVAHGGAHTIAAGRIGGRAGDCRRKGVAAFALPVNLQRVSCSQCCTRLRPTRLRGLGFARYTGKGPRLRYSSQNTASRRTRLASAATERRGKATAAERLDTLVGLGHPALQIRRFHLSKLDIFAGRGGAAVV